MQKQLDHYEFKKQQKVKSNNIIFVLDNLEHQENIGSAFRLADAFNIKMIMIISKDELDFKKIEKISRNCNKNIPYKIYEKEQDALRDINEMHYMPINIEITSTSKPLREVNFADFKNVALIVGNERYGVSEKFLDNVPLSCHIEMYGNNSSMNVSTSLAIAAYKVSEDLQTLKENEICDDENVRQIL